MKSTSETAAKGVGDHTILWRRLDRLGYESARLSRDGSTWCLAGSAVFAHDRQPCRLDYRVLSDAHWRTVAAHVAGWVGREAVAIELAADSERRWRVNGRECAAVTGCIDLDLNFSPSTNLLPIRRLGLAVGEEAEVKAAWLRFPGFALEPLSQVYRRISAQTYRYESAGGAFTTELPVNAAGFVIEYPSFWAAEAVT
ncbi:MAG TPA: putative glycolipid-binding domain-containing protein [Methylomirabilota bacterium]|nr:putative glycolipid-binding domain-containing protein [Methylomirabilota bacterium]